MIARRLVITGRVHGVGFRDGICRVAEAAGVAGWVRNRRDGTVEAVLQGSPDAVDRVVDWAHAGPPAARVTRVDVSEAALDATLVGFECRATA